jgi:hypothetical protein
MAPTPAPTACTGLRETSAFHPFIALLTPDNTNALPRGRWKINFEICSLSLFLIKSVILLNL